MGLGSKGILSICKQIKIKNLAMTQICHSGFPLPPQQFVAKEINISDLGLKFIKLLSHLQITLTSKQVFVDL